MARFKRIIKQIMPPLITDGIRKIGARREAVRAPEGWQGNYATWAEAANLTSGYDAADILERVRAATLAVKRGEAAYERDSVLFHEIEYNWPLVCLLLKIALENHNELSLIDFGGALGSSYFQNKALLNSLKSLHWSVVEQSHYVECGRAEVGDGTLGFFTDIDAALAHKPAPAILLSSVLQYLEEPYALLAELKSRGFRYLLIDRIPVIDDVPDRITVQHVPEEIYRASYPAWFFNRDKFLRYMEVDYTLVASFDSYPGYSIHLGDVRGYVKGYFFEAK